MLIAQVQTSAQMVIET